MNDWMLWVVVVPLIGIFVALFVIALLADYRRVRREMEQMNTWVLRPSNPTDDAYEAWLLRQDISTWPYEPEAGYDERKEGA